MEYRKRLFLLIIIAILFTGCYPIIPSSTALPENTVNPAASQGVQRTPTALHTISTTQSPKVEAQLTSTPDDAVETPMPENTQKAVQNHCPDPSIGPRTYYVRMDGNDQNSGLDNLPESAFKTIEYAVSILCGGDHLYVEDGVYTTKGVMIEHLHGTPNNPTIISAINPWEAKLIMDAAEDYADGIRVTNSSHLNIIGFEVAGSPGSGIDVRDGSHHVVIKKNYVRDNGCNGISSRTSDYLVFESNVVRGNARLSEWNCSGISIWHPIEHDQEPGYHIIVGKNVALENECDLPFRPFGHKTPTDGNGIIIDDFRNTQGGGQEGGYQASVLVENNLSFNNGGRGIHVFESDNVTIRNNTVYHNLRILTRYFNAVGDLSVYKSNGSQVYNNLVVQDPDIFVQALHMFANDGMNTKIYNNIIVGNRLFSNQTLFIDSNQFENQAYQEFPQFINPTIEVEFQSIADFRKYFGVLNTSPAVRSGVSEGGPVEDLDGVPRPEGLPIDIGCYQRSQQQAN